MKYILLVLVMIFSGCSCKPRTLEVIKTVNVDVPIKCIPKQCDNPLLFDYSDKTLNILERAKRKQLNDINKEAYSECLEASVRSCR